jgi:long-chain acyl-CoA synthetase
MSSKPWFKSYDPGLPHTLQPYPNITLADALRQAAHERPDNLALLFKGTQVSYSELDQYSNAFAAGLVAIGVQPGERVANLMPNSPQAIIAQYGTWKAGAIACPINPLYTEWELEHALQEIEAETVVVLNPYYNKVKALQAKTKVRRVIAAHIKDFLPGPLRLLFTVLKEKKDGYRIQLQPGDYMLSDLLHQYAGKAPQRAVKPTDPAILLFSGGTTGSPKAVLGLHRSLVMSATQLGAYAGLAMEEWKDRLTGVMPLFHIYGNMAINTAILRHWPIVMVPNPRDLDDLVNTLNKTRPAMLHGVPTLFTSLLNHPKVKAGKVDFKSIKVCYSAAAPMLAELKRDFEALTGGRLLEAYAMTETILAAVVCPMQGSYKEGSTGVPLPDVDVRIIDLDTGEKDLGPGEIGEVLVTAPQIMECYWGRPDETANMLRNGWIHTGDVGYMDEDGYLFLIDRKKDLVKPGGFQVWPREVEEIIATHPAVSEVCVGGVPDPHQTEAVKAWVVLQPGQSLTAEELQNFCRQKLSGYKVPRYIEFRETLPKNLVGKTLRRVLVSE